MIQRVDAACQERDEARAGVAKEQAWIDFASKGRESLEEMTSTMLIPSSFSPLK
ncbi:MAG: NIPSNAP family protein [Alphaproteobacteria bacterium]